jgi:tyrosine-protein phosphatase YwqE
MYSVLFYEHIKNTNKTLISTPKRNVAHIFQNNFFKIHFNIILPLIAMTSKKYLLIRNEYLISKGIYMAPTL